MTHAQLMIEANLSPTLMSAVLVECIEACFDCAKACRRCESACNSLLSVTGGVERAPLW
jgi:hypothetical protein